MSLELKQYLTNLNFPQLEWAGIRKTQRRTVAHVLRDGKPQANERSTTTGVMVEVLVKGQFGYACTNQLSPKNIHQAFVTAYAQALEASRFAVHAFTPQQRPPSKGSYHSKVERPMAQFNTAEVIGLLNGMCAALKVNEHVVKTLAVATVDEVSTQFASTNGAEIEQHFTYTSIDAEATAEKNGVVQTRTLSGGRGRTFQKGVELYANIPALVAEARLVGEQAVELLSASECPNMTTELVLAPDQMMLQIHESIGHPLELDRILGDERNYAGSSFVALSDFGTLKYGSPLLNVTFDPSIGHELASYAFDDTGAPAERKFLIQKGKLVAGLGGLESQARSGVPGVANSRAETWNRAPIDRMANLNVEPGKSSFESIIGSIEKGVYMQANRSWSIDDYRNKFQFGCEYARLIENGKLTKTVRNPNYRGMTSSFWHSLSQVGDAASMGVYGTPYCGKGEPNQVIRVGHASPVCAFSAVEIFGGAI